MNAETIFIGIAVIIIMPVAAWLMAKLFDLE